MIVLRFCSRQLTHYYPFISSLCYIRKHVLLLFQCIQWLVKHNVQKTRLSATGKYGSWCSSEDVGGAGGRVLLQSEVATGAGKPLWEIFSDQVQRD